MGSPTVLRHRVAPLGAPGSASQRGWVRCSAWRLRSLPTDTLPGVLQLTRAVWSAMVGHAYDGLPDEACGLFAGPPGTDRVRAFYPCRNAAASC